mgnify:CR=1 FL=1
MICRFPLDTNAATFTLFFPNHLFDALTFIPYTKKSYIKVSFQASGFLTKRIDSVYHIKEGEIIKEETEK